MQTAQVTRAEEIHSARWALPGLMITILVLLAIQTFVFWLLLIFHATIYQQQLLLLLFVFGMIYPVIHVVAMLAVLGPGTLAVRQTVNLLVLIAFMGMSLLLSYLLFRVFFQDAAWATLLRQPINRGGIFDWVRFPEGVDIRQAVLVFWTATPALFVICQVPYWVWAAVSNKPQLSVGHRRASRPAYTTDLFFITAILAVAFAGISFSLSESRTENGEVVEILSAILSHLLCVTLTFVFVCWPALTFVLRGKRDIASKSIKGNRPMQFLILLLSLLILSASFWVMLNRGGPTGLTYSLVWVVPIVIFGFPYSLLMVQLHRYGLRLSFDGQEQPSKESIVS